MPIYTYKCTQCEQSFETRQSMADDPLTECPNCDGRIRRVINSVGVVFKGSGFYVTDNRNGKSKNGSGKSSRSKTEKQTTESSTTDKGESAGSTGQGTTGKNKKGGSADSAATS